MKVELGFKDEHEIICFKLLLSRLKEDLEELKDRYCCDPILYDDADLINFVLDQFTGNV